MIDPDVFAVLMPTESHSFAACGVKANQGLQIHFPSTGPATDDVRNFSRQPTPACDQEDVEEAWKAPGNLFLRFSDHLEERGVGWRFGASSSSEVVLHDPNKPKMRGVSRNHFFITIDASHRILLHNVSPHGMSVAYDGQNEKEIRHHFTWILFLSGEQYWQHVTINVPGISGFRFKIEFPHHGKNIEDYEENLKSWVKRREQEGPPMQRLCLTDPAEPPTEPASKFQTPSRKSVHVNLGELGRGGFGVVHKHFGKAGDGNCLHDPRTRLSNNGTLRRHQS
ncbi:uncharacterized protein J3D65DRAFT_353019 [Phyllosticta citribraziliensis]|uniref:Uncharacterized protein n=1 Tax=Phyllosticta citribraziliensis TaxID=989973 RepID=A0ABR1LSJ0_9PEZI